MTIESHNHVSKSRTIDSNTNEDCRDETKLTHALKGLISVIHFLPSLLVLSKLHASVSLAITDELLIPTHREELL